MKHNLYPLRFHPILKERIWGGQKLQTILNKNLNGFSQVGESWEISGLEGDVSLASNGPLAGEAINKLVEIYGEALMGKKIYERFGNRFPLLIKYLDAADDLSVQVHPNDELAMKRHQTLGKTEMWYIIQTEENARIACGFNSPINRMQYLNSLHKNEVESLLNYVQTKQGDVFYIPSGRVHSIGQGVLLAEVQQASDLTYRIYDYNRKDNHGMARQLHTHQALDAIDFSNGNGYRQKVQLEINQTHELVHCPWFNTNLLKFDSQVERDLSHIDSFVIYMLVEGACTLQTEGHTETLKLGDTILIPASFNQIKFYPLNGLTRVLGIYVE